VNVGVSKRRLAPSLITVCLVLWAAAFFINHEATKPRSHEATKPRRMALPRRTVTDAAKTLLVQTRLGGEIIGSPVSRDTNAISHGSGNGF